MKKIFSAFLSLCVAYNVVSEPADRGLATNMHYDPAYNLIAGSYLFNTTGLNITSPEEAEQLLLERRSSGIWSAWKNDALRIVAFLGGIILPLYRFTKPAPGAQSQGWMGDLLSNYGAAMVVMNAAYIIGFFNRIPEDIELFWAEGHKYLCEEGILSTEGCTHYSGKKDSFRDFEIKLMLNWNRLDPALTTRLSEVARAIRTYPNMPVLDCDNLKKTFHILDIPHQANQLIYNAAYLDNALSGYHPEVVSEMKDIAYRLSIQSTQSDISKKTLFFIGEPGTGKTKAAQELAKSLKAPVCEINLAGKTVEHLEGVPAKGTQTSATMGLIAECLLKAGSLNPIIILDDGDRSLSETPMLNYFLALTDPAKAKIQDLSFGPNIKVPIGKMTFIFTANHDVPDEAFQQRVHKIWFNGFNSEYIKSYISSQLLPDLKSRMPYVSILSQKNIETKINEYFNNLNTTTDISIREPIEHAKDLFYHEARISAEEKAKSETPEAKTSKTPAEIVPDLATKEEL